MTTTVNFTFGGTSVDVNGPDGPTDVIFQPLWVTAITPSGVRWAYTATDRHIQQWAMTLRDLTASQMAAFLEFFHETAAGPTNPFSYTHTDGQTYTARFVMDGIAAKRTTANNWDVPIKLELVNQLYSTPA